MVESRRVKLETHRSEPLNDQVRGHIHENIRHIENHQGNVEFVPSQFEIFNKSIDFGIANVASVDESEQPWGFISSARRVTVTLRCVPDTE